MGAVAGLMMKVRAVCRSKALSLELTASAVFTEASVLGCHRTSLAVCRHVGKI